jgi:hypothetical protein
VVIRTPGRQQAEFDKPAPRRLGRCRAEGGGYAAYASYAKKVGLTHAQCWTHSRRGFFEAEKIEPQSAHEALQRIGALYAIEDAIREHKLTGGSKRLYR